MCWIWEAGCNGDLYAAWTQAIGSILALMVAIAIAYFQGEKERVHRERDTRERHLGQLRGILFLAKALHQYLIEIVERNPTRTQYDKQSYTEPAGDFKLAISQHSFDQLTDDQRTSYFMLRRRSSEIFGHIWFGDEFVFIDGHIEEIWELVNAFQSYLESQR